MKSALRDPRLLRDAPRPGAPATFTPEQICQIGAVGCEPPADRAQLGQEAFEQAWAEAKAMDFGQAVGFVLSDRELPGRVGG